MKHALDHEAPVLAAVGNSRNAESQLEYLATALGVVGVGAIALKTPGDPGPGPPTSTRCRISSPPRRRLLTVRSPPTTSPLPLPVTAGEPSEPARARVHR